MFNSSSEATVVEFVKTRISKAILSNEIPAPRDAIIICLINTCDVFRFIFQVDDEAEERIQFICQMDLIGRSMADVVAHNLAGPLLRRSALTKEIPAVRMRKLLLNPHVRDGKMSALFADLAQQHGPVFEVRSPLCEAHDLPGWAPDKPLGASERAHVPEGQGLLYRLRKGL